MSYMARPSLGGKTAAAVLAAKKKEAFSFPMLSFEEICVCLQEMGIHVDEDDLVKGKADIIRNVYEQLIYDCLGMTKEELYQAKLVDGDILKYEELHEESIPVVHFVRAMHKLLNASGIAEGYALRDLTKPDPARVRRNLSGIVNFQKYREEKLALYRSFEGKAAELADARAALQRERAELMAQLHHERSLRAAEQPHVDALTAEMKKVTTEQATIDSSISDLKSSIEQQKYSLEQTRNDIKLMDIKIEGAKEELEIKRSQIVASPARLKAELDNAARSVEEARLSLAKVEMDRKVVQRKSEIVAKADKDVHKTLVLLSELETEIVKLKKIAREVKTKQTDAETHKNEVSVMQAQVEHLERTLKRADEKCVETKQSKFVKEEAATRAVKALRTELVTMQDELARVQEERRAAEVKKIELDTEREAATKRHNAEMAEMLSAMKSVQKTVADYHAKLARSMHEMNYSVTQISGI